MALDFLRQLGTSAGRRAGYRLRRCPVRLPDGRGGRVDGPARRDGPSCGWLDGPGGESDGWDGRPGRRAVRPRTPGRSGRRTGRSNPSRGGRCAGSRAGRCGPGLRRRRCARRAAGWRRRDFRRCSPSRNPIAKSGTAASQRPGLNGCRQRSTLPGPVAGLRRRRPGARRSRSMRGCPGCAGRVAARCGNHSSLFGNSTFARFTASRAWYRAR